MHGSVKAEAFPRLVKFEGTVPFMHCTAGGAVACAVGCTFSYTEAAALAPEWRRKDGTAASYAEIVGEWLRVQSLQSVRFQGSFVYAKLTNLRLSMRGMRELVERKLAAHEVTIRGEFPAFDGWPADAQLAVHLLAWGTGGVLRFAIVGAYLQAGNFAEWGIKHPDSGEWVLCGGAAAELAKHERTWPMHTMLANAGVVVREGGAREVLHYPDALRPGE